MVTGERFQRRSSRVSGPRFNKVAFRRLTKRKKSLSTPYFNTKGALRPMTNQEVCAFFEVQHRKAPSFCHPVSRFFLERMA